MFIRILVILVVLASSSTVAAQIVNVHSKFATSDSEGVFGGLEAASNRRTGNTNYLALTGKALFGLRFSGFHTYFLWNGAKKVVSGDNISNHTMEHLRFRYDFTEVFSLEAFGQHDFNEFKRLSLRALVGGGPRIQFEALDMWRLALGLAYMFEVERLDDAADDAGDPYMDANVQNNFHRMSSYLRLRFDMTDSASVVNTTFIQPRLADFNDFRLLNELSMQVDIVGGLGIKFSFAISYDSQPAMGVEGLDTFIGSSLTYSFEALKKEEQAESAKNPSD